MTQIWPEKPTCHNLPSVFTIASEIAWRDPEPTLEPYGRSFRTCSYCGSIHPEDLYNLLTAGIGVRLGGSDWKYGWPHKFYVEGIPNPLAGQRVRSGSSYATVEGKSTEIPICSIADAHTTSKWYNEHLNDLGDEAFALLAPLLAQYAGVEFFREDGKLQYRAPYRGYQR